MDFTGKRNQQKEIPVLDIKAEKIAYGYLLLKGLTQVERNLVLDVGRLI